MKKKLSIIASVLAFAFISAPNAGAQWIKTNSPYSGNIRCFAVSGTSIFAGTGSGGMLRSTDNGIGWIADNSGLTSLWVDALAVNGSNLFAGGDGVFISNDNGNSWSSVNNGLTNLHVQALAVLGANLFAGTDTSGVFLSTDNGSNWSAASNGLTCKDVYCFAVSGSTIFAGTVCSGVFISSDNGANWTAANNGIPANAIVCQLVVGGKNGAPTIFAVTSDGVFLSSDNGADWTKIDNELSGQFVQTFAAAVTTDSSMMLLFAGTRNNGVFFSLDTGISWHSLFNLTFGPDSNVTAVAAIGPNLYAGTDTLVWQMQLADFTPSAVAPVNSMNLSLNNYPNPFSKSTTINFSSPENGLAEVTIVNLLGSQVARIFSGELNAGEHEFSWDASGMAPGMYECVVLINGQVQRVPMALMR